MRLVTQRLGPLLLPLLLLGAGSPQREPAPPAPPKPDPLAALGFTVTGGAAPGYIEDRACALCHNDLWRSYQEVGMARSFAKPRTEVFIEDFENNRFHHEPSDRWYEMRREGDRLIFRRWKQDAEGRPIHVFEREVDWILGSGHTSRVYLYQNEPGDLYQLPLAWYSQGPDGQATEDSGHWGMSPGYDKAEHPGVLRQVRRECMFCHNAYPDVEKGSDAHGQPHFFPRELPEGTGCQRCHGPGAEHARRALRGVEDVTELNATIVNPGKLPDRLRNSVCYECHLQPTVLLNGVRRFGRTDYSFRPGEPLSDYLLKVDIDEEGQSRRERFEINHHPYRLEQSLCFAETQGKPNALSCLTCHDPHRKVPREQRAAHYRAACLTCHQPDACRVDEMTATAIPHGGLQKTDPRSIDPQDCVGCHMPRRRTQDVVQVVMTDHLIQRQPGGPELVAPVAERDPVIVNVELLEPIEGPLREVYRAVSVLRTGVRSAASVDHLQKSLAAVSPEDPAPYLELARGQLSLRRYADAEATIRTVLTKDPDSIWAISWLAAVAAGKGNHDEALAMAHKAQQQDPSRAELHFNLGRLLLGYGYAQNALPVLRRAVELRPNLAAGWFQLGETYRALERSEEAAAAYRRALEIDPDFTRSQTALEALPSEP